MAEKPTRLDSPVMTAREVAKLLRIQPAMVYRLGKQGALRAFKIGSDWRFNREEVERFARSGKIKRT